MLCKQGYASHTMKRIAVFLLRFLNLIGDTSIEQNDIADAPYEQFREYGRSSLRRLCFE